MLDLMDELKLDGKTAAEILAASAKRVRRLAKALATGKTSGDVMKTDARGRIVPIPRDEKVEANPLDFQPIMRKKLEDLRGSKQPQSI
jgi:hypothetical protein